MDWYLWLKHAAFMTMLWGAYVSFRKRPRALRYGGKVYYPMPDGRFCTRWGRIIRDPALLEALAKAHTTQATGVAS